MVGRGLVTSEAWGPGHSERLDFADEDAWFQQLDN